MRQQAAGSQVGLGILQRVRPKLLAVPGNMNIHLENIIISNISSHPIEIIGIKNPAGESGAYGKKMQGGPIGDIFELISKFVNSNGKYTGTTLSNSQLIIAKSTIPNKGATSITTSGEINTLKWVEEQQELSVLTSECYLVGGGDPHLTLNQLDTMAQTISDTLKLHLGQDYWFQNNRIRMRTIDLAKKIKYLVLK